MTLLSSAPEIDKQQIIGFKLESSSEANCTGLGRRFRNHNSTLTIKDEDKQGLQLDRFSHSEIYGTTEFHLVHH
jgi:hypothetical protein